MEKRRYEQPSEQACGEVSKLPSTWEPIDAEMYAILAYLRKMASASDAQSRRCLVLCDCKPALQQIESAYRKGMPEGLRDWGRAAAS